jgi:hypothetical protein
VEHLANPNIWWRRNAQRLLIDRGNKDIVPALEKMARKPASAVGRLHALWTLEGMGQLQADVITNALKDSVSGLRLNAIKLAELHLKISPALVRHCCRWKQILTLK